MKKTITDTELVKDFIAGNEKAFEILIKKHQANIYGFICSKILDKEISKDIMQDTFVKVILSLKSNSYNEEGKFLPWVLRISYNLIMDHFRETNKNLMVRDGEDYSVFAKMVDCSQSIESKLIITQVEGDLKILFGELLEELLPEQKEILVMRIYQDIGFKEIAEITGVSINTSLGRMRYALVNLKKVIDKNKIILEKESYATY